MKRALIAIGVVLAVAAAGLALWIKDRRANDEFSCALDRLRDLSQTGCDVMSWWPAIGMGALAVVVLFWASKTEHHASV